MVYGIRRMSTSVRQAGDVPSPDESYSKSNLAVPLVERMMGSGDGNAHGIMEFKGCLLLQDKPAMYQILKKQNLNLLN